MTDSRLREQLLKAGPETQIPGFVNQCASIASFRSFIGFYHSQEAARQESIENRFARANRMFDRRPTRLARNFDEF